MILKSTCLMKWLYVIALLGTTLACAEEPKPETKVAPTKSDTKVVQPKVTFVELGSVNCIPCKAMKKVMDNLEAKYPQDLRIVFHDVWTEAGRPAGQQYGIRTIPTQVFLDSNGVEYFRHEGYFPQAELEKILQLKQVSK